LREASTSSDPEVRIRAERCLKEIEINRRVTDLIKNLKTGDPGTRATAADDLMQIGPAAQMAVTALIEALDDPNRDVRVRVTSALENIGPAAKPAVPKLISVAEDKQESEDLRFAAVACLGNIGDGTQEAVPSLLKLLQDDNSIVRRVAAHSLGKLGQNSKEVVPALLKALQDEERDVQRNAAWALGRLRKDPERVIPALDKLLGQYRLYRGEGDPRPQVLRALQAFGGDAKRALPTLLDIVADRREHLHLRTDAITALGKMGPSAQEGIPKLEELLETESLLKRDLTNALDAIRGKPSK
jgi:HEAT repeat protein